MYADIVRDLFAWQLETGKMLPKPPHYIALCELEGWFFDLITGEQMPMIAEPQTRREPQHTVTAR